MDAAHQWILDLGAQYGVNPYIFGAIYVGAIPFFLFSVRLGRGAAAHLRLWTIDRGIADTVRRGCALFRPISIWLIAGRNHSGLGVDFHRGATGLRLRGHYDPRHPPQDRKSSGMLRRTDIVTPVENYPLCALCRIALQFPSFCATWPLLPFVPLRVLSSFSMLEGAIDPEGNRQDWLKERGFPAIAICDRNGLYGSVMPFAKPPARLDMGVQPDHRYACLQWPVRRVKGWPAPGSGSGAPSIDYLALLCAG